MDAAVCILVSRPDEASSLKGYSWDLHHQLFEDAATRKYMLPRRIIVERFFASLDANAWVPAVKGSEFIRTGTVEKSMDPSLSIRKKIMHYNGRIVVADKMDTLLCSEYILKGNLDEYLELDWQSRFNILKGICTILAYLLRQLKHRICHLDLEKNHWDIKASNILLDCNMEPKIADFGLSRCLREERSRFNISMGTNGIVKYNERIALADMRDEYHGLDWQTRLNIIEGIGTALAYIHTGFCHYVDLKPANVLLDENMVPKIADEKHGSGIPPSCFGEEARKMRSCGCGKEARKMISTDLAFLMSSLWMIMAELVVCTIIIYQNWRTTWKFESSSKQIKRLNQIVLSCLETGKSAKATSSTLSSTQRAVHAILILASRAAISIITEMKHLPAYNIAAPNMDSNGLTLAAALSVHQHNLTDEQSDKPRSNRAAATNTSDETIRSTPTANKLTDDEAENHSDPNSCVAERDTIEEEKRSGEWFVATGAAHHATWNRGLFSNLVDVDDENNDGGLCVHAADGTPMPVRGRGDVVTDDVVLPDVYYVPGLCANLVSVGQLAGLDYCVGFGRGACVISGAAGTVVGRAHARGDGLYEVDFLRVTLGRIMP